MRNAKYHFPPLPLLDGNKVVELDPDLEYLTTRITDRAVGFIEANKDRPFFLYLAEFLPHSPLHVSPPFMKDVPQAIKDMLAREDKEHTLDDDETRNKLYPNAISEIDWSVGRVLDTLKRLGIDDNTLVFFTSDRQVEVASGWHEGKGQTGQGEKRTCIVRFRGRHRRKDQCSGGPSRDSGVPSRICESI